MIVTCSLTHSLLSFASIDPKVIQTIRKCYPIQRLIYISCKPNAAKGNIVEYVLYVYPQFNNKLITFQSQILRIGNAVLSSSFCLFSVCVVGSPTGLRGFLFDLCVPSQWISSPTPLTVNWSSCWRDSVRKKHERRLRKTDRITRRSLPAPRRKLEAEGRSLPHWRDSVVRRQRNINRTPKRKM